MITCEFEFGKRTTNLRHVTVDAVIVRNQQILLTQRATTLLEGGKWAIPGGFMDRNETAAQAIAREVLEETGYTTISTRLLEIRDQPQRRHDDRQNVTLIFAVTVDRKINTTLDLSEVTALRWFSLNQLPSENAMAFDHLDIIKQWTKR